MFGYIIVNKQELKFKEFDLYRSYYCGLCRTLRERYGLSGQMTLTYDLTFLVLLLTDLYQDEAEPTIEKCIAHPIEKHPTRISHFTGYAADMNLLLSYYQSSKNGGFSCTPMKKTTPAISTRPPAALGRSWLKSSPSAMTSGRKSCATWASTWANLSI